MMAGAGYFFATLVFMKSCRKFISFFAKKIIDVHIPAYKLAAPT